MVLSDLARIAVGVGEEEYTLEEVMSHILSKRDIFKAQGRVLTPKGWEVTQIEPENGGSSSQLSFWNKSLLQCNERQNMKEERRKGLSRIKTFEPSVQFKDFISSISFG